MYIRKGSGRNPFPGEGKLYLTVLFAAVLLTFPTGKSQTVYGQTAGQASLIGNQQESSLIFENDKVEAGVPLKVLGASKDCAYLWKITGADGSVNTFTTTVNYYIPSEKDEEKMITVTEEGLEGSCAFIYYSTLPVVYINYREDYYSVSEEYTSAFMKLQGNEAYVSQGMLYDGDIYIKLRGNSTKLRDKRPFNIKLEQSTDLLGMGKNKHWALLANYIDHTLMRNKLLYDLSGTIGMDTYMKSENVVLIFNGLYYGVYQLCEQVQIDNERVYIYDWENSAKEAADAIVSNAVKNGELAMDDAATVKNNLKFAMYLDLSWISDPNTFSYDVNRDGTAEKYKITDYIELPEPTGGVLLEMDFFAFDGRNPSTLVTAYSQPIYFKTPEYAISSPDLFGFTKEYIQSFEYALHSTDFTYHEGDIKFEALNRSGGNVASGYTVGSFSAPEYDGRHYSELFDIDSLVQYFLMCELSMNWDGMKNSVFLYKDIDGLFHMGPVWDFDWAWGNINMYNTNTWYPTSWHTTEDNFTVEQYYQTVQWNRSLIRDPYFLTRVFEKYKELRGTAIEDLIKAGGTIDSYAKEMTKSAAMNDARWGYSYDQYNSVGFEGSLDNMKNFLNTRIAWMDEQFTSLDTLIASFGSYQPSSELAVAKIDPQALEGYTEITADVTDPNITYVTFQVNGTHMYTAEVIDSNAVCPVPNSDLISDDDQLNVVQILARDAEAEYIISSEEEGNYYNAESNYAVFYHEEKAAGSQDMSNTAKADDISVDNNPDKSALAGITPDSEKTDTASVNSDSVRIQAENNISEAEGKAAASEVMADTTDKVNNSFVIAAVIIGGVIAAALAIFIIKFFWKRRRSKS